jgi:hypothetical protein
VTEWKHFTDPVSIIENYSQKTQKVDKTAWKLVLALSIYIYLIVTDRLVQIDYSLNSASTLSKFSKKLWNVKTPRPGSKLPVVARIECMLSCGIPQSIALIPVAELSIGPTVPPLLLSFLIWNT